MTRLEAFAERVVDALQVERRESWPASECRTARAVLEREARRFMNGFAWNESGVEGAADAYLDEPDPALTKLR